MNTNLSEDEIVLLDGELDSLDEESSYVVDEEMEERVEKIINDRRIDVDDTQNKQKLKSRQERQESSKVKFQKDRKELYKHREKLLAYGRQGE
jgi:hypothetical protein